MKFLTMRSITFFIAVLLFGSAVRAEQLTLDDCIELALANRASIIRARGSATLANWDKRAALGQFLPNVDASYRYSKGKQQEIDPPDARVLSYDSSIVWHHVGSDSVRALSLTPNEIELSDAQDTGPNKVLTVSGSWSVLNLSNYFDYFASKANADAARLDVISSEQDLIYSVKLSYYAYLASVENVATQEEAAKRSEEQLKLIQSKYDLGSASLSDVLKQKVQFGNDKLALLTAKNSVTSSHASLAYTIGIDPHGDVEFSTEYSVREYEGTLDEAISFSLENKPAILSADRSVSASSRWVKSAQMRYLPSLSLYGDLTWFNGTQAYPVVFDYSYRSHTIGFAVNWSIFDGFFREREVSRAKINLNNARAGLADERNLAASGVKTAYLEIEQYKESKAVAGENVAAAEEDLKITQEKYNLGAATILDLLDAQVSLKTAQVSLIQADFNLNLAIAKLENAMGKM
jgi:outer membrane protein